MVLLVVFRYNVDHALHFSHIVAHADGDAQFALCGHIGIAVELKQIVVHRAAPLLQRIMIAGNTVAQLLPSPSMAMKARTVAISCAVSGAISACAGSRVKSSARIRKRLHRRFSMGRTSTILIVRGMGYC